VRPWLLVLLVAGCRGERPIQVGSKKFTESVLLGELATQLLRNAGIDARHRAQLGGTRLLWRALTDGRIDVYPEYSGTLCQEILNSACDLDSIERALAQKGVRATRSLGFRDGYALAVRRDAAARLQLARISDLVRHPGLRLGFSEEFLDRADGWPALRARYRLPQRRIRALDHDLAYRGLVAGDLDVIDVYTTDPELASGALVVLDDDRHLFAAYDALLLYRDAMTPTVSETLRRLEGAISERDMRALNARAKVEQVPEARLAADFLKARFGVAQAPHADGLTARLRRRTEEHLVLVGISLLGAILLGVPLGIIAARWRRLGRVVVGFAGLAQTIPSLALLVFMIPLFGIGVAPALVALLVYSLLPIVRNTLAGLDGIPRSLRESAAVLGLGGIERLRLVELPLASPSILAGIQTAAVIDVGMATLGALIGAGGYGQPILTGIRLDDTRLILEGAVPAAALALVVQASFEGLERVLVPRGLRRSLARPPA
jgi:osmoprotectant transport system permease protein